MMNLGRTLIAFANKHHLTVEQALSTKMAANYAEYLLDRDKDEEENLKGEKT